MIGAVGGGVGEWRARREAVMATHAALAARMAAQRTVVEALRTERVNTTATAHTLIAALAALRGAVQSAERG